MMAGHADSQHHERLPTSKFQNIEEIKNSASFGGIVFDHGRFPKIVSVHSIERRKIPSSPGGKDISPDVYATKHILQRQPIPLNPALFRTHGKQPSSVQESIDNDNNNSSKNHQSQQADRQMPLPSNPALSRTHGQQPSSVQNSNDNNNNNLSKNHQLQQADRQIPTQRKNSTDINNNGCFAADTRRHPPQEASFNEMSQRPCLSQSSSGFDTSSVTGMHAYQTSPRIEDLSEPLYDVSYLPVDEGKRNKDKFMQSPHHGKNPAVFDTSMQTQTEISMNTKSPQGNGISYSKPMVVNYCSSDEPPPLIQMHYANPSAKNTDVNKQTSTQKHAESFTSCVRDENKARDLENYSYLTANDGKSKTQGNASSVSPYVGDAIETRELYDFSSVTVDKKYGQQRQQNLGNLSQNQSLGQGVQVLSTLTMAQVHVNSPYTVHANRSTMPQIHANSGSAYTVNVNRSIMPQTHVNSGSQYKAHVNSSSMPQIQYMPNTVNVNRSTMPQIQGGAGQPHTSGTSSPPHLKYHPALTADKQNDEPMPQGSDHPKQMPELCRITETVAQNTTIQTQIMINPMPRQANEVNYSKQVDMNYFQNDEPPSLYPIAANFNIGPAHLKSDNSKTLSDIQENSISNHYSHENSYNTPVASFSGLTQPQTFTPTIQENHITLQNITIALPYPQYPASYPQGPMQQGFLPNNNDVTFQEQIIAQYMTTTTTNENFYLDNRHLTMKHSATSQNAVPVPSEYSTHVRESSLQKVYQPCHIDLVIAKNIEAVSESCKEVVNESLSTPLKEYNRTSDSRRSENSRFTAYEKPYDRPRISSSLLKPENKPELFRVLKTGADEGRQQIYDRVVKLLQGNVIENCMILLEILKTRDLTGRTKQRILSVIEEIVWHTPPRPELWK